MATSGDGSIVVGTGTTDTGSEAFVWDRLNGMRNFRDLLVSNGGVDLTGWILRAATGISDDGRTIVGWGENPDGNNEAWSATFCDHLDCNGNGVPDECDLGKTDLIVNGGFETQDFTGWTQLNSGSGGIAINDGTFDPPSPDGPLAPCDGGVGSVTFQGGPGQHTLYQQVTIPANANVATLSWIDRIRNHANVFSEPNQEFRCEIWDVGNVPMREVFSTNPGDPLLNGCTERSFDISDFIGQTVRIAFTQQDDLSFFNAHLDRVTLLTDVGATGDCNGDNVPDDCESFFDCNDNGVNDVCDINSQNSSDCNDNGIPDECDVALGSAVLYASAGQKESSELFTIDLDTGQATSVIDFNVALDVSINAAAGLAVAPDNRTLFVSGGGSGVGTELITYDTVTGQAAVIGVTGEGISDLTFLPDGTLIGTQTSPPALINIDTQTAAVTTRCTLPVKLSGLTIAPDGVVYGTTGGRSPSGTLFVVDPTSCAVTQIGDGTGSSRVPGLVFAPDGRLIGSDGSDLIVIDRITGDGVFLTTILGASAIDGLAFVGGSPDCNSNGVPDECDLNDEFSNDCNGNGVPDECDIASGGSENLLTNGTFDQDAGGWTWQNVDSGGGWRSDGGNPGGNFILNEGGSSTDPTLSQTVSGLLVGRQYEVSGDFQSVFSGFGNPAALSFGVAINGEVILELDRPAAGAWERFAVTFSPTVSSVTLSLSAERNGDDSSYRVDNVSLVLVSMESDCNQNGIPDECDITEMTSSDINENGIPDECEGIVDCNGNFIPDDEEIANCDGDPACGDCDQDAEPDECSFDVTDCDASGLSDECEIAEALVEDCNSNAIPDDCDIADMTSSDINQNGVPDECEAPMSTVRFVDDDAPPGGNGLSWQTAFDNLQDALAAAGGTGPAPGPGITEIWIAAGTYKPDRGGSEVALDRSATFQLISGVTLYGGLAGNEDPAMFDLSTRDFVANKTILSGDLLGDDVTRVPLQVVNINSQIHASNPPGDQPLDVPVVAGLYQATLVNLSIDKGALYTAWSFRFGDRGTWNTKYEVRLMDGTGLTGGSFPNANSDQEAFDLATDRTIEFTVPTDQSLKFFIADNQLSDNAGGVSLLLSKLVLTGNQENSFHVVTGSGSDATAVLDGVTITAGNANGGAANDNGGGMYNDIGGPTLRNCTLRDNKAGNSGGGMFNLSSNPVLSNCVFRGNESLFDGGGMFNDQSAPVLTNCTFSGNTMISVGEGGAMFNDASNAVLTNCILWGDESGTSEIFDTGGSVTTASFSDIAGGFPGAGNIDADPLFFDKILGDLRVRAGSPCIDAGNNSAVAAGEGVDLGGNPRFIDDISTFDTGSGTAPIVDMGAYEFQPPACMGSAECDDGVFCNGAEACIAGACFSGQDPCPGLTCNEVFQACEP